MIKKMKHVSYQFLLLIVWGIIPMTILASNLDQERQQVITTYMKLLNEGQYAEMAKMFTTDGLVDSPPVKGSVPSNEKMSASKFYQMATEKKFLIKTKVNNVFLDIKNHDIYAVHLTYKVVGETPEVPRSAIDIFEFEPNSAKIKLLTAIVNK